VAAGVVMDVAAVGAPVSVLATTSVVVAVTDSDNFVKEH
jgi:hypothetical protein